MFPETLFHVAGVSVNLNLLFYALGVIPAILLAVYLARRQNLDAAEVLPLAVICIAAAFLGGPAISSLVRMYFGLNVPGTWAPAMLVAVIAILSLYLAAFPAYRRRIPQTLDIAAPAFALYWFFARLGCFSGGCCYGRPAEGLWWAVTFPAGHSYAGIPIHPTQLYEAFGMLAILALLLGLRKVPAFEGALIWVFLATYGLLRFVIEFYRGDLRPMVGLLSLNQAVCLLFFALGGAMTVAQVLSNHRRYSQ
jgi:phosphatidylglycerol:prolipoprotein diacylglycerol transferase